MDTYSEIVRVVACAAGALCYTLVVDVTCWKRWAAMFVGGFLPAAFICPSLAETIASSERVTWVAWESPHAQWGLSFFGGLLGHCAIRGAVAAGDSGLLGAWVQRWLGMPPQAPKPPPQSP